MTQKRRNKRNISGWIVLDKPFDVTSTQAVGKLKFLFEAKKAGHAGTLDPLATGILPIALGEATKTVPYIQDGEKIYRFDLVWGSATETDDAEGAVIETSDRRPTEDELRNALPQFTGVITQIPPAYSAIKIKGERAYDLARAGEKVEVPPREVEIEAFELISHSPERSSFEVTCQKGTYVRALARDLARVLGTCGHVGALRRTRVGPFAEEDAVTVDALEAVSRDDRDAMLLPVSAGIADLPEVNVDTRQSATIRLGNPVLLTGANAPIAMDEAAAICAGELVAIGYVEKGQFKPSRVILPG
ncbi:tRNA pseudouridine(55) synthase TruB [Cucumibacter marinus]|uniref:tRNA pseudouridine(55) synthase TruB n=1 Tax=Cucumibacter marinus TaxID=1121252 RepID=UPI00048EC72D|nr:tRNA pseudouridine(55) synthase TruB [Cucumibacter marinus]